MEYVYRTALMILADEEDAHDIVQDTFLIVWDKRKSLRTEESLKPLLRKIAVNKCYDHLRRKKIRRVEFRLEDGPGIKSMVSDEQADKKLENDEAMALISIMVEGLSPRQRLIFSMVELEKMSHSEVSELTGINKTSIKSNLRHARKKLEDKLKNYIS